VNEKTLREQPGIDLFKVDAGAIIWAETKDGVYRIMPTRENIGDVIVESTVLPLRAGRPMRLILEKSIYDDRGRVSVAYWIAKNLKMLFRASRGSFMTASVETLSIEAPDGSWNYEL